MTGCRATRRCPNSLTGQVTTGTRMQRVDCTNRVATWPRVLDFFGTSSGTAKMRWPTHAALPSSILQTARSRTSGHWRLGTPSVSGVSQLQAPSVARVGGIDLCTRGREWSPNFSHGSGDLPCGSQASSPTTNPDSPRSHPRLPGLDQHCRRGVGRTSDRIVLLTGRVGSVKSRR